MAGSSSERFRPGLTPTEDLLKSCDGSGRARRSQDAAYREGFPIEGLVHVENAAVTIDGSVGIAVRQVAEGLKAQQPGSPLDRRQRLERPFRLSPERDAIVEVLLLARFFDSAEEQVLLRKEGFRFRHHI